MNTQLNNIKFRMLRYVRNLTPSLLEKVVVSLVLVFFFLFLPKYSFYPSQFSTLNSQLEGHFLFAFSHANIFHLAGNVLCLYLLKIRLRLPIALAVSFVCSWLPQWSLWGAEPILGFSGVLFAAVGIAWGRAGQFKRMLRYCLLPTIVFGLFPHIAMTLHIYTLLLGYAIGYCMLRFHRN